MITEFAQGILRYRTLVLIIIFYIKSILRAKIMLSQKNLISNLSLNKLQVFHFRSTVHTNTTLTVITHSYGLQKPPFFNNNGY